MRRSMTSYIRSFTSGLLLAALPVGAFLGVDYLLAPPSPGAVTSDSAGSVASGIGTFATKLEPRVQAVETSVPEAASAAPAEVRRPILAVAAGANGSGQGSLVVSIQQELQRVGCYSGAVDGTWSEKTRASMQAFNSSVRVSLPTTHPDYILLTLLQGHSSKACTRSCDSGSCVDRSIEARAVAPGDSASTTARSATAAIAAKAWSTTTVAAAPIVVLPSDRSAVRAIEVSPAASPAATAAWAAPSPVDGSSPAPLPGRMAVGAPPSQDGVTGLAAAPIVRDARPAPPPRARAASGSGSSGPRLHRTFTDLTRSAP